VTSYEVQPIILSEGDLDAFERESQAEGTPYLASVGYGDKRWLAWVPGMKISVRAEPRDVYSEGHGPDKVTLTGRFIDVFAYTLLRAQATPDEVFADIANFMGQLRPGGFLPPVTLTIWYEDGNLKLSLAYL
jgi:hypothetical protein